MVGAGSPDTVASCERRTTTGVGQVVEQVHRTRERLHPPSRAGVGHGASSAV